MADETPEQLIAPPSDLEGALDEPLLSRAGRYISCILAESHTFTGGKCCMVYPPALVLELRDALASATSPRTPLPQGWGEWSVEALPDPLPFLRPGIEMRFALCFEGDAVAWGDDDELLLQLVAAAAPKVEQRTPTRDEIADVTRYVSSTWDAGSGVSLHNAYADAMLRLFTSPEAPAPEET